MNKNIQVFNNAEFGEIRTLEEDGKILFSATDAAGALGYANVRDAVSRHCRYVVKRDVPHPQNNDKTIEMNFIPESDLYRLIVHSRLESAQRFEMWIFEDVLPSIRQHGMYITSAKIEDILNNPDYFINILQKYKAEREMRMSLEAKAQEDKPKVLFADSVSASNTSILIGDLAKLICQNGVNIGQNRLFAWLRDEDWLISRKGGSYNMPTQKGIDSGFFEIKERTINNPDGSIRITKTPKITGKGQVYFINLFLGDNAA